MKDPDVSINYYRKLRGHPYDKYAEEILNALPPDHQIDICDISDLAVSNIYPMFFKFTVGMGNHIKYYSKHHIDRLKMYLKSKSYIILYKYVQIDHPDGNTTFIGQKYTKPSLRDLSRNGMELKETDSTFIISNTKQRPLSKNISVQAQAECCDSDVETDIVNDEPTQELLTPSELLSVMYDSEHEAPDISCHQLDPDIHCTLDDDLVEPRLQNITDSQFDLHTDFRVPNLAQLPEPSENNRDSMIVTMSDTQHQSIDTERLYSEYESTKTMALNHRRYYNMFLKPQNLSNKDFLALIHIDKKQFLEFVKKISIHYPVIKEKTLNMYSRAFLFRLRIASCWTQAEVSSLFGLSETTGREMFWKMMQTYYEKEINIPNFLLGDDVVEKVLDDAYSSLDPYYKELLKLFEDPAGKCLPFFYL